MEQEKIDPASLVPMDIFADGAKLAVAVAYIRGEGFSGPVYRPEARLWLQEELALVVVLAAWLARRAHGLGFVLYDGLRTVDAQRLILESPAVKANPQWLEGPDRVLSAPGQGGHPRAMAVDIGLMDGDGKVIEMGFDHLPLNGSGPAVNPAHRLYADLPPLIRGYRRALEEAMVEAARRCGLPLLPLPVEWWDFRFPASVSGKYAPLEDRDLPLQMRMTGLCLEAPGPADFSRAHFAEKKETLLRRVHQLL